jgi:glycosyltransferase involved in cell wall biosynthesis
VKRFGLEGHVDLLGQAGPSEKRALFERHDVFLTTSSVDNFPVSVLEASAAGLPVVAARVGGLPAMLDGSADVVEGNARELSEAVARLINDVAHASSRSQAGRTMAERCGLDVIADRWQSVFQAL